MKIPLKDGTEGEVDPTWIRDWCELYFHEDVMTQLHKARLWALATPAKRKTKRGLRKHLNNVWMKDCRLKPQVRMINPPIEDHPHVPREVSNSAIAKMKELLK